MGLRRGRPQQDPLAGQTPMRRTPGPQTGTTGGVIPDLDPMSGYKNEDLVAQQNADREAFLKRSPKPATAAAPSAPGAPAAAPVGTAASPSPGAPQVMPKGPTAASMAPITVSGQPNNPAMQDQKNPMEWTAKPGEPATAANRPSAQPTAPVPAKQSVEANSPLSGDTGGEAPTGTITAPPTLNPASAFGVNRRGSTSPVGSSSPNSFSGGFGPMERTFSNPGSAGLYHDYVQRLFGNQGQGNGSMLRRSPEPAANRSQMADQE
jgi:hypothetical protein